MRSASWAPQGTEAEPFDALWAPAILAALYFTIAHRKLRAVVIPLTLLLTVVLGGVLAVLWLALVMSCVQEPVDALAWSLVSAGLALSTMALGASVFGGRKAIDAVARMQERGLCERHFHLRRHGTHVHRVAVYGWPRCRWRPCDIADWAGGCDLGRVVVCSLRRGGTTRDEARAREKPARAACLFQKPDC